MSLTWWSTEATDVENPFRQQLRGAEQAEETATNSSAPAEMKEPSKLMMSYVAAMVPQSDWPGRKDWQSSMVNRLASAALMYMAEEALVPADQFAGESQAAPFIGNLSMRKSLSAGSPAIRQVGACYGNGEETLDDGYEGELYGEDTTASSELVRNSGFRTGD